MYLGVWNFLQILNLSSKTLPYAFSIELSSVDYKMPLWDEQ